MAKSPRVALERALRAFPMPPLDPWITPGRGITGKRAYLQPGGVHERTWTRRMLGGTVTVEAAHTAYDVDWGDGDPARRYPEPGGTIAPLASYGELRDFPVPDVQAVRRR